MMVTYSDWFDAEPQWNTIRHADPLHVTQLQVASWSSYGHADGISSATFGAALADAWSGAGTAVDPVPVTGSSMVWSLFTEYHSVGGNFTDAAWHAPWLTFSRPDPTPWGVGLEGDLPSPPPDVIGHQWESSVLPIAQEVRLDLFVEEGVRDPDVDAPPDEPIYIKLADASFEAVYSPGFATGAAFAALDTAVTWVRADTPTLVLPVDLPLTGDVAFAFAMVDKFTQTGAVLAPVDLTALNGSATRGLYPSLTWWLQFVPRYRWVYSDDLPPGEGLTPAPPARLSGRQDGVFDGQLGGPRRLDTEPVSQRSGISVHPGPPGSYY